MFFLKFTCKQIHCSVLYYFACFVDVDSFEFLNFTQNQFLFTDHTQHSDHSINISEPIIDSRQTSPSLRHSSNLTSSPNDRNSRHIISKSESSPECGPVSADSFGESQTAINLGK